MHPCNSIDTTDGINKTTRENISKYYHTCIFLHISLYFSNGIRQKNNFSYCGLNLECPRGVMVKAMNCGIVVREFVLQSRYYVHFRANTLGKGMNPLILPPAMGK